MKTIDQVLRPIDLVRDQNQILNSCIYTIIKNATGPLNKRKAEILTSWFVPKRIKKIDKNQCQLVFYFLKQRDENIMLHFFFPLRTVINLLLTTLTYEHIFFSMINREKQRKFLKENKSHPILIASFKRCMART